jgi:hypothetical protein
MGEVTVEETRTAIGLPTTQVSEKQLSAAEVA